MRAVAERSTFSPVRSTASGANPGTATSTAAPIAVSAGWIDTVTGRRWLVSSRGITSACSTSWIACVPPWNRLTAVARSPPSQLALSATPKRNSSAVATADSATAATASQRRSAW